jgi:aspartyl protease family protein
MKKPAFLSVACLAAAIAAGFSTSPAPAPILLMSATELKANDSGHFVTTADINGTDIKVLVDTGATVVALSYEDANDVGLHPSNLTYDVPVNTANGSTEAARVRLDKIEIDGVRVDGVDGLVMPEGALNGTLLGMSFLGRLSSFKVEDGVLSLKE